MHHVIVDLLLHFNVTIQAIPRDYKWNIDFLTNRFVLRDCYNNQWLVKLSKSGDQWYFDDWKDFCSDNKLEPADYVTFEYKGKHKFEIKILGLNMCQKKGVGATIKKEQVENNQDEETRDQVAEGIEDCGESEDEERTNQDSEEIGYCGEIGDDSEEEEPVEQVPKKSKAKFQSKLKACGASSSRATESPGILSSFSC